MSDAPKLVWVEDRGPFVDIARANDARGGTPYIRIDAPELVALVDALRREECPWREGTREHMDWFAVSNAALAAWDALTGEAK